MNLQEPPSNQTERGIITRSVKAFTLLELLVVIGILGLLAALILGSVSGAKARAHTVACQNNLKQLAVAVHLYGEDGEGAFPLAIWRPVPAPTGGVTTNISFDDLLYPYLGIPLTPAECIADRIPLTKRLKVLTCPADKIAPAFPTTNTWRRTYSMSEAQMASEPDSLRDAEAGGVGVCYSVAWGPWPTVARPAVLKNNAVLDPHGTLALVERPNALNYGGNDHWAVTRRTGEQRNGFSSTSEAKRYHSGRFVYVFCDGRVEALAPEATWGRTGSDLAWAGAWTLRPDD